MENNTQEHKKFNEEEDILIVCNTTNNVGLINFLICNCNKCDTKIYLNDTTIKAVKEAYPDNSEDSYYLVCIDCGKEILDNTNIEYTEAELTNEQLEEISNILNITKQEVMFRYKEQLKRIKENGKATNT